MDKRNLDLFYLKSILLYSPQTGEFIWLESRGRTCKVGQVAGTISAQGYIHIIIDGKVYRRSHLAWFYVTGKWPQENLKIDHINRNRSDDSWINLREITHSQNKINTHTERKNSSGYLGVSKCKDFNGSKEYIYWRAVVTLDGKVWRSKRFKDPIEAAKQRDIMALEFHKEFAVTNFPKEDYL